MVEKFTLYVNTSARLFANFLCEATKDVGYFPFPQEETRRFHLNSGIVNNNFTRVRLPAYMSVIKRNEGEIPEAPIGTQYEHFSPAMEGIIFDLFPLAGERTRVIPTLVHEIATDYFMRLFERIAEAYPETREQFNSFNNYLLERLGLEKTEGENKQRDSDNNPPAKIDVGRIAFGLNDVFSIVADFFRAESSFYSENFELAGMEGQWTLFHPDLPRVRKPLAPKTLPQSQSITVSAKYIPNDMGGNISEYPDKTVGRVLISPVQDDCYIEIELWKPDDLYLSALFVALSQSLKQAAGQSFNDTPKPNASILSKQQSRTLAIHLARKELKELRRVFGYPDLGQYKDSDQQIAIFEQWAVANERAAKDFVQEAEKLARKHGYPDSMTMMDDFVTFDQEYYARFADPEGQAILARLKQTEIRDDPVLHAALILGAATDLDTLKINIREENAKRLTKPIDLTRTEAKQDKRDSKDNELREIITRLYKSGNTDADIASQVWVGKDRVKQIRHELGLKAKPRKKNST